MVTWTIGSSVASGIKIVYENGKFITLTKQGYVGIIDRDLIQPPLPPIVKRKANFVVNKTNNATVNVTSKTIYLEQGQTLKFGTTELDNAYSEYDTYIRLYDPNLVEVDSNDDYNGRGSLISHTALMTGMYTMHIGGYGDNYCDGTYAWEVILGQ